jgi:Spy/CpxP family protein refolding chaperone
MASKVVFACVLVSALSFLAALGSAEDAPPTLHQGPWPIHHGRQHQPTQDELNAQHQQDVTSDQAGDINRLYDQLMSNSEKILKEQPALVR